MINIDGNYLEGGGQIVRTSLAFSIITNKPVYIKNIRKGRDTPGLKSQHLNVINGLKQLFDCKVEGDELGSEEITFYPGKLKNRIAKINIGTAGSIPLVLQSLILACYDKNVKLELIGGTSGKYAPPIDYVINVIVPQLKKYMDLDIKLMKRGYYPKGGGLVEVKIKGKKSDKEIILNKKGKLMQIRGISHSHVELKDVAERQAKSAELFLKKLNVPINIRTEYVNALSYGSGITLWAIYTTNEEIDYNNPVIIGADVIGEKGKKAENIGEECALKLLKEMEEVIDVNLIDNLIPYMGLFGGKIKGKASDHTLTNIYVTEKFLNVKFNIKKEISCKRC